MIIVGLVPAALIIAGLIVYREKKRMDKELDTIIDSLEKLRNSRKRDKKPLTASGEGDSLVIGTGGISPAKQREIRLAERKKNNRATLRRYGIKNDKINKEIIQPKKTADVINLADRRRQQTKKSGN